MVSILLFNFFPSQGKTNFYAHTFVLQKQVRYQSWTSTNQLHRLLQLMRNKLAIYLKSDLIQQKQRAELGTLKVLLIDLNFPSHLFSIFFVQKSDVNHWKSVYTVVKNDAIYFHRDKGPTSTSSEQVKGVLINDVTHFWCQPVF